MKLKKFSSKVAEAYSYSLEVFTRPKELTTSLKIYWILLQQNPVTRNRYKPTDFE